MEKLSGLSRRCVITILWPGRGMMPDQISEEIKAGGIILEDIAL